MNAEDFVELYHGWLGGVFTALHQEKGPDDNVIQHAASPLTQERRVMASAPEFVLPVLAELAKLDPALVRVIQRSFFEWLLERKVLRPVDPRIVKKLGRPPLLKPAEPKAQRRGRGAPKQWTPEAPEILAGLVEDVKKKEKNWEGQPIRKDIEAIIWLLQHHAKTTGAPVPNWIRLERKAKTWANKVSAWRASLPTIKN